MKGRSAVCRAGNWIPVDASSTRDRKIRFSYFNVACQMRIVQRFAKAKSAKRASKKSF